MRLVEVRHAQRFLVGKKTRNEFHELFGRGARMFTIELLGHLVGNIRVRLSHLIMLRTFLLGWH